MTLAPGTRFGAYEITHAIGAGGMGEVYRARDTKLHRDVAIKVLPEMFAADRDRLMRFEREAQSLAALNHPNIAQVFAVLENPPALAMELVDGEDLSQRIARGPIQLDEALPIARQVAEALEAAHERGIVHRDLKPANIKVRDDGTVKVLDFGLAKAMTDPPSSDVSGHAAAMHSPTFTSPAMTQMGVLLGTAAYMSPEQARGKAVDKRADIWAFGVILMEMLTGRPLFAGETVSDVLAGVLRQDVPLDGLPADVPRSVRRLLARCLEKDPRRRLRDIGDARLELDEGMAPADIPPVTSPAGRRRGAQVWVAAAVLGAAIVGSVAGWLWARRQEVTPATVQTVRFDVVPPPEVIQISNVTMSADSRFVVYLGYSEADSALYVHRFDTGASRQIPGTKGGLWPFLSPDGKWAGFYRGGKLQKIALAGGDALTICESNGGPGALWLSDGRIVFSESWLSPLSVVPEDGGKPTPYTTLDTSGGEKGHWWPAALPDGRLMFTVFMSGSGLNDNRLAVADVSSGKHQRLFPAVKASMLPSGHLLFYRAGRYQTVKFNLARLAPEGDAAVVLEDATDLDPAGDWPQPISVSATGGLAYVPGKYVPQSRAVWISNDGKVSPSTLPVRAYTSLAISPDGEQVALSALEDGKLSTRIVQLARGAETDLDATGMSWDPVWHPDGRLSFTNLRKGDFDVFIKDFSRPDPETPILDDGMDTSPSVWTRDGQLVYQGSNADGTYVLKLLRPGESPLTLTGPRIQRNASISPDGKWFAFSTTRDGRSQVYVQPFPGPGPAVQVSPAGADNPAFRSTARELYFRRGRDLVIATWEERAGRFAVTSDRVVASVPWTITTYSPPYSVAPDGRVLALVNAEAPKAPRVKVVLGWIPESSQP